MNMPARIILFILSVCAFFLVACDDPVVVPAPGDKEAEQETVAGDQINVQGQISLDRNYYLVFDGSGSMGEGDCRGDKENNVAAAKWATKEFVTKSLPPEAGLGLFVFDRHGTSERVPIGKDNRQAILNAIDAVQSDGGTPLNSSIARGVDALRIQREKQLGYGGFTLLIITDGEADTEDGVAYANRYGIPIVTIGFCLSAEHPLAKYSISYRSALNPQELLGALQEVLAESDAFGSGTASYK